MNDTAAAYKDFTTRLKLLAGKQPELITTTLSNIFTMRLVGNKTHGDLAEIAIAEFINQYMLEKICIAPNLRKKISKLSTKSQIMNSQSASRLTATDLCNYPQTKPIPCFRASNKKTAISLELIMSQKF